MMNDSEKQEIIIVKRYGGGDDGHHGGAWKIAFADFMTAMMALFLVLWLVNAANEETKKSVASYFNPVKLVDRNRSKKGLDNNSGLNAKEKTDEESEQENPKSEDADSVDSKTSSLEQSLISDPFNTLNKIASVEVERLQNLQTDLSMSVAEASVNQDAFLDPFSPGITTFEANDVTSNASILESQSDELRSDTITTDRIPAESEESVDGNESQEANQDHKPDVTDEEPDPGSREQDPAKQELKSKKENEALPAKLATRELDEKKPDAELAKLETKPQKIESENETGEKQREAQKLVEEISEEIRERLAEVLGADNKLSENLTVEASDDGVLISITDKFSFSMFQNGSAVPRGQLVLAIAEISKVLKSRSGKVRVYGHTDSRPYNSNSYDNWRLSTARAHSARLMLVRGGFDTDRISQVSGFSDRRPKLPDEPESAANRRIEILLEMI